LRNADPVNPLPIFWQIFGKADFQKHCNWWESIARPVAANP